MIHERTKIYDGNSLAGGVVGVCYLPLMTSGTIVRLMIKTDENVSGEGAVFSCRLNGAPVPEFAAQIAVGSKIVIVNLLAEAVAVGDELVFSLDSGAVSSPVTFAVFVDDGAPVPTGWEWRGEPVAGANYFKGDVVRQNGKLYICVAPVNTFVSYNSVPDLSNEPLWDLLIENPSPSQSEIVIATASLADNATENAVALMGKHAIVRRIQSNRAARVRAYSTSAARAADAARAIGTEPANGVDGLLLEAVFAAGNLALNARQAAILHNADAPAQQAIYWAIQNRSGAAGAVEVTITKLTLEN